MRELPRAYVEPSTLQLPPPPPPSRSSHHAKSNLPMLYYGLVVVGTAAIVLAIYNLIIIKWCTRRQSQQPTRRPSGRFIEVTTAIQSFDNTNRNLLSSFKYKKDINITGGQDQGNNDYECPVCLSVFEEGEEVRRLPRCKHSFHAPCIDMRLYSHFDCPLCRAPVDVPSCHRHVVVDSQEHSRENLLGSGNSSTT